MTLLAAAVAGFLAARLLWLSLRPTLATDVFLRQNFRGSTLPTAAGLVIVASVLVVEAGRLVVGAAGWGAAAELARPRAAMWSAVVGFGILGLIDDLAGSGHARGFRGHLSALGRGRLTTGALKLTGGIAVALLAVATARPGAGLARLLIDAALVALAANLGNLFDRRPGRTTKVGSLAFLVLVLATTADARLAPAAVVLAAAAGTLIDDLHERLMLGDTGANVVGAAVGLGVVTVCPPGTRTVVAVAILAANLVSEVVSFSRIIDSVPPLRALDRAGRRDT